MNDITEGLVADADLSAKQYYPVKVTSTGVNVCADGERADGILQNKPTSGKPCTIRLFGVSFGVCGGAVTQGTQLAPDSTGRLTTATSGDEVIALALEDGSGAASEIRVAVTPNAGVAS